MKTIAASARPHRRQTVLKAVLAAATLAATAPALSACNTAEGFGRDVEAAGDTIEDTAEDVAN